MRRWRLLKIHLKLLMLRPRLSRLFLLYVLCSQMTFPSHMLRMIITLSMQKEH